MNGEAITVRRAESVADVFACREAQRLAWGIADDGYLIPIATMVGVQHHGGLVLGAFEPDGRAVGVSFAFLGRSDGRWCLYSQLTGVIPGYQGRGIGAKMKAVQREYAASIGLDFIAWAFDPLQAGNAHFNLHRLGASAGRYFPDMYGPRTDALNAGVPTDRLIAEWPTRPGEPPRIEAGGLTRLVEGMAEPAAADFESVARAPAFLVEIPADIGKIRAEDPMRAGRWRSAIAGAFTAAFAGGFRAVDVIRDGGRTFYVLKS